MYNKSIKINMRKGAKVTKMEVKNAKLWTLDGSYYTESVKHILTLLGNDFKQGKEFYTISDKNGDAIALAVLRF